MKIFALFILYLGFSEVRGNTIEDMPTSRPGKWETVYTYTVEDKPFKVHSKLDIRVTEDKKKLIVKGSSKDKFRNTTYVYEIDLTPIRGTIYKMHIMSSLGIEDSGTIEVGANGNTKTVFKSNGNYSISTLKKIDDVTYTGEEKTYNAEGKLISEATYKSAYKGKK